MKIQKQSHSQNPSVKKMCCKRKKLWYILTALLGAVLIAYLCSCSAFSGVLSVEEDNIIEEIIEGVIEKETGIRIDFTPNSPEKYESSPSDD